MIHSNLEHELSLQKKIKKAQNSIRKKTLVMKIGRNNMEQEMDFYLKALKEPLEKIVQMNENKFLREEKVRKRLIDDAHDVLESAKKQRERLDSISFSPKSTQSEKKKKKIEKKE